MRSTSSLSEAARRRDGDLLLLAGPEILRRDVDDAVGVDVEGDLDLRHAARRRRQADQVEAAERPVVARQRPLALQHVHLDARLAVGGRREDLALARRNRRVPRNQRRHHAAERLDAERQRRHVEQQQILDVAGQHAGLDRRADRDDFVRVHALVRLLAEQLLDDRLHLRNARRAADQHDLVDLRRVDAGVGQRLLGRADGPLQQVVDELLELGARQLHLQVLGTGLIRRDERQVDVGLHHRGELHLGLLRRFLQALQRHAVLRRDRCRRSS